MKIAITLALENNHMEKIIRTYWKTAMFTVLGAGLGFAYWRFVGCTSGTCPLTANWHTSTLMGGLIGLMIVPKKRSNAEQNGSNSVQRPSETPDYKEN